MESCCIMKLTKKNVMLILFIIVASIVVFLALFNFDGVIRFLGMLLGVLAPFIIGAAIAFILNIPLKMFEERLFARFGKKSTRVSRIFAKLKRPISVVLSILTVSVIILIFVLIIVPEIIGSIISLAENLPEYMRSLSSLIDKLSAEFNISLDSLPSIDWQSISKSILSYFKAGGDAVISFTAGVVSAVFDFILAFVFAIYVLASKEKLGAQLRRVCTATIGSTHTEKLFSIVSFTGDVFTKYVVGQCTEAIILGVLCYIGMLIFSMPYALMISSLIALTALIPIFGAFIGTAVGAFMILLISPVKAVWFVVYIIVLQQIESNLIYPRVVGKSVGLPGLWVLAAVTIGGGLFGFVGMLISVPIASIIYTLLKEALKAREAKLGKNAEYADSKTDPDASETENTEARKQ